MKSGYVYYIETESGQNGLVICLNAGIRQSFLENELGKFYAFKHYYVPDYAGYVELGPL
jgi:hypothetical protein